MAWARATRFRFREAAVTTIRAIYGFMITHCLTRLSFWVSACLFHLSTTLPLGLRLEPLSDGLNDRSFESAFLSIGSPEDFLAELFL